MKDTTKRKLLGESLYKMYRRARFLSYKRRKLKREKKEDRRLEKKIQIKLKKERKKKNLSIKERIKKSHRVCRFLYRRRKKLKREKKEKKREEKLINKGEREKLKIENKDWRIEYRQKSKEKNIQLKIEKKHRKKRRRRLIRFVIKRRIRRLKISIKSIDKNTFPKLFRRIIIFSENKDERNNFLIITINSTIFFVLSYLFLYIISQLATVIAALQFDYKTILFYHKIYFNIDKGDWFADSVKILFSTGPVISLFFGIIFVIIYSKVRREDGLLKLFFLWGFIHAFSMFFGALLAGTLLNQGFGWVVSYLYYRDTGKMVISIISIFILFAIGTLSTKSFLFSANSYFNYQNKQNRKFFILSQVFIPFLIGSFILIFLKIPNDTYYGSIDNTYYEIFIFLSIILVLIPVFSLYNTYPDFYFDESPKKINLVWKFLIVMVIIIILFRFGLSSGIHFG
ncbi:MAG: hypothetical protein K8R58_07455 [Bacteroidales bacterium]|nr:hypothetical protein [Bacteroidales bacterium]